MYIYICIIYIHTHVCVITLCLQGQMPLENEPTIRWRCLMSLEFLRTSGCGFSVQNGCPSKIGWESFCELENRPFYPFWIGWPSFLLVHLTPFWAMPMVWQEKRLREIFPTWTFYFFAFLHDMDRTKESNGSYVFSGLARFSSRTCHGRCGKVHEENEVSNSMGDGQFVKNWMVFLSCGSLCGNHQLRKSSWAQIVGS